MGDNENQLPSKPSEKRLKFFKKEYPFPIIKNDDVGENETDISWKCMEGELQENCVFVHDEESMALLYRKGFYGKGTLSKNAPQVCLTKHKQSPDVSKGAPCPGSSRMDSDVEVICLEDSLDKEPDLKSNQESEEIIVLSDSDMSENESSAKRIKGVKQNDSVVKESLQLTFQEAYFLSYGLGCLLVKDKGQPLNLTRLWNKFCELTPDNNFPVMYTAYHHFRSKGWIVKCGLKYGVDYVLYKDGPPFNHASYSVVVKPVKEQGLRDIRGDRQFTWNSLAALNRINSQAGKELIFLYVIIPHQTSESKLLTPLCISQYKVEEVLFKRWVPSENREEKD